MVEQNKPVRSRDEQVEAAYLNDGDFTLFQEFDRDDFENQLKEAEERGAAEQRQKDAEGQLKLWIAKSDFLSLTDVDEGCDALHQCATVSRDCCKLLPDDVSLYTHPANVAALEDRIRVLEEAIQNMRNLIFMNNAEIWMPKEILDIIDSALKREGGV